MQILFQGGDILAELTRKTGTRMFAKKKFDRGDIVLSIRNAHWLGNKQIYKSCASLKSILYAITRGATVHVPIWDVDLAYHEVPLQLSP